LAFKVSIKGIFSFHTSTTQTDQGFQSFQQTYFLGHHSYLWGYQESYSAAPIKPLIYKGFIFKYLFK